MNFPPSSPSGLVFVLLPVLTQRYRPSFFEEGNGFQVPTSGRADRFFFFPPWRHQPPPRALPPVFNCTRRWPAPSGWLKDTACSFLSMAVNAERFPFLTFRISPFKLFEEGLGGFSSFTRAWRQPPFSFEPPGDTGAFFPPTDFRQPYPASSLSLQVKDRMAHPSPYRGGDERKVSPFFLPLSPRPR